MARKSVNKKPSKNRVSFVEGDVLEPKQTVQPSSTLQSPRASASAKSGQAEEQKPQNAKPSFLDIIDDFDDFPEAIDPLATETAEESKTVHTNSVGAENEEQ